MGAKAANKPARKSPSASFKAHPKHKNLTHVGGDLYVDLSALRARREREDEY
jgi:hypothetical protein